jgi:hypothetical protein
MRTRVLKLLIAADSSDGNKTRTAIQVFEELLKDGLIKNDQINTVRGTLVQAVFARLVTRSVNGRYAITSKGRDYIYGPPAEPELSERPKKRRQKRRKAS